MSIIKYFCRSREFRERLDANRDRLYRIAYSWCHDPALADDLVQETLEKALKKGNQLRDPKAMDTWLYSILNNCWRDHFRRSRETVDIDEVPFASDSSPEEESHSHLVAHQVRQAIETLPLGQRQVLTLVDLEGCSYIEVANILEIPVGTVMSRLCRARRALKERLLGSDLLNPSSESSNPRIRRIK
ncbi:MAG TPA: RNA polymerase sigma factor [Thiotrichales bacterium]|nr:RNA polymerase sigma factor [Thiotrichales bacterium]